MAVSRFSTEDTGNNHDLVIPWSYVDPTLNDEVATEQHKARRGQQLQKRSIRHYRHATTKGVRRWKASVPWYELIRDTISGLLFASPQVELASSMDSPTFRALVCALTVSLVIASFVNLGFTLRGVANGSLIFGKSQLEIEEGMMKKAQDEMRSSKAEV